MLWLNKIVIVWSVILGVKLKLGPDITLNKIVHSIRGFRL
jgi:hypothetical protein